MASSGYPGSGGGGGLPGLYGEIGRSMNGGGVQIGNNSLIGNPNHNNNNNMASSMYRFQQQQQQHNGGGILTEQNQIGSRRSETTTTPSMIGKRSLAQFQSSYQQNSNNLLLQQRQQQQNLAFLQQQQQGQQQFLPSASTVSLLRLNNQTQFLQHHQQQQGLGSGMGMGMGSGSGSGSFLRNVKQRTSTTPPTTSTNSSFHNHHNTLSPISPLSSSIDLCSPNLNNHNNHNNNNYNNTTTNLSHHQDAAASCLSSLSSSSSSSAARLGVPLYNHHSQQLRHHNQPNNYTSTNNSNNNNQSGGSVMNFGLNQGGGQQQQQQPTIGYSNLCPNRSGSSSDSPVVKPDPDNNQNAKILEDLEKELLGDDDDDDFDGLLMGSGGGGDNNGEGDAVSVITNSEWSDTFNLLSSTNHNSTSSTNPSVVITSTPPPPQPPPTTTTTMTMTMTTQPAAVTNNNQISPSPSSSTSSSCSSSATPPPPSSTPSPPVSLKQLFSEAATAISDGNVTDSTEILTRISQVSNRSGTPDQKLAYYMLHALRCRNSPTEYPPPVTELFSNQHASSFRGLCDLSPCFKYPLLAANLAILDTVQESHDPTDGGGGGITILHIVDFDIGCGDQYTHLLHTLPINLIKTVEIRITAVNIDSSSNDGKKSLSPSLYDGGAVNEALRKVAERIGVKLRFEYMICGINELSRDMLRCDDDETLVVNFAYRLFRVPDESVSMENLRDELLRRVKSMYPNLVTLIEQEMNVNTAPFVSRVVECGGYYKEVIDSLENGKDEEVVVVEEGLGRKAVNTVACEGRERVERCEVFGKWRSRMGMAGFKGRRMVSATGGECVSVVEECMKLCRNVKFAVKEDGFGGVCFGWNGKTLTVASAWR